MNQEKIVFLFNELQNNQTIDAKNDDIFFEMLAKNITSLNQLDLSAYSTQEKLRAFQLFFLENAKKQNILSDQLLTPDGSALLLALIIKKMVDTDEKTRLYDPAFGTGNLIYQLIEPLNLASKNIFGAEKNTSIANLAQALNDLLSFSVNISNIDAIDANSDNDFDLIASELPVGEKGASQTNLFLKKTNSWLKNGAFAFYFAPFGIEGFTAFIKDNSKIFNEIEIISFLSFKPNTSIVKDSQKSILIFRKKGDNIKGIDEILLGTLPSLDDEKAVKTFLSDVESWKLKNL